MRLLVGIAVQGSVVEMALPADIALAHLLPEVRAIVAAETGKVETGRLLPRRVDGEWLDLERSLGQQAHVVGGLICLEHRGAADVMPHHDPVVAIADRGPPLELLPDAAAPVVIGASAGVLLAMIGGSVTAVVVAAAAPAVWTLIPMLGGIATAASAGLVRRLLSMISVGFAAAAAAVSGLVASGGPVGACLDGCIAAAVLVHVGRRRSRNALLRVTLGGLEWCLLGAVLPLAAAAAGWSGW